MHPCPRMEEFPSPPFKRPSESEWRENGTCNYCGSMSPEQVFESIEKGATVIPTDKDYKIYIEGVNFPGLTGMCKFYFQHFSRENKIKFIRLVSEGSVKFPSSGGFVVLPFFMSRVSNK